MIHADIRLIIPFQGHPRALELAKAAMGTERPVFMLMPQGGVDWRGDWSEVSIMSVRAPLDPIKINVVHVSQDSHWKMVLPGAQNLMICTEEIPLPVELGDMTVVTADKPITPECFKRWLSFVS